MGNRFPIMGKIARGADSPRTFERKKIAHVEQNKTIVCEELIIA